MANDRADLSLCLDRLWNTHSLLPNGETEDSFLGGNAAGNSQKLGLYLHDPVRDYSLAA